MMTMPVPLKVCLKLGVMVHASSHWWKLAEARDTTSWEPSSESLEAISKASVFVSSHWVVALPIKAHTWDWFASTSNTAWGGGLVH